MQDATWLDRVALADRRARNAGAGEIVPTWMVGQPQPQSNPLLTYAHEGYSKNSLIYSCVREVATSFASLQPILVRRDQSVVKRHRVLDLLANPNTYQDYEEFGDLLATHYEVAGNAYIHKVRVSAYPERRREFAGYPVQELQLIRPDYVTIEPGATKAADVFVVTIGGTVRQRIPRADMIHIHEPNMINDFYGLSKIALLVREGDIDLKMSDFELAFYTNAGVPFGLLSVKNRQTSDQVKEIKSNWRRAYNNVKGWFDLLVLNEAEATYQQLAIQQSDMEGDSTRFHVESRICSVYGIPPILVGARVAMNGGGTTFTYEDAQHAFWAETMVPKARRFGGALTAHLLSEFALIADDRAVITYDFTQVRALQEDRSLKLREVVRLVLTGGFTVNQALLVVGLPTLDGGDFYVRQGNHVIARVTSPGVEELEPMTEPGGTSAPNPDNPLEGAARLDLVMGEIEELLERGRP
jgi:HK97 family phage portal protein